MVTSQSLSSSMMMALDIPSSTMLSTLVNGRLFYPKFSDVLLERIHVRASGGVFAHSEVVVPILNHLSTLDLGHLWIPFPLNLHKGRPAH